MYTGTIAGHQKLTYKTMDQLWQAHTLVPDANEYEIIQLIIYKTVNKQTDKTIAFTIQFNLFLFFFVENNKIWNLQSESTILEISKYFVKWQKKKKKWFIIKRAQFTSTILRITYIIQDVLTVSHWATDY